jgi:hypothetical protein
MRVTQPFGLAQGREPFDFAQDRESFDFAQDRELVFGNIRVKGSVQVQAASLS